MENPQRRDRKFIAGLVIGLIGGLTAGVLLMSALLKDAPVPATISAPSSVKRPSTAVQTKELRSLEPRAVVLVAGENGGRSMYRCAPGYRTYDMFAGQTLRTQSGLYLRVTTHYKSVILEARPGLWSVADVIVTTAGPARSDKGSLQRPTGMEVPAGASFKVTLPAYGSFRGATFCLAGPQG